MIISMPVMRSSEPHSIVAMTALIEWLWMQAPAPRMRYAFINSGVHSDCFKHLCAAGSSRILSDQRKGRERRVRKSVAERERERSGMKRTGNKVLR